MPAGANTIEAERPHVEAAVRRHFSGRLSPHDREALQRILDRLAD